MACARPGTSWTPSIGRSNGTSATSSRADLQKDPETMVICTVGRRRKPIGWPRDVFDLRIVARSPRSARPFVPKWSERILEWSLLRAPEVLARAVGVYGPVPDVALKQVSHIDLYFTLRRALHLVEVKKPSEYRRRHL